MYEQNAPTTMVQPTLCEVIYHGVQENCVLDDLYTPFRLRGLSGDTGRTSVYGAQSYTDPTTVGRRTPPGFVHPADRLGSSQYNTSQSPNRLQTALSLYSTNTNVPSKSCTVPPGAYYPDAQPAWSNGTGSDAGFYHQSKERAKTAPCTAKSLPVLQSQRHAMESRQGMLSRAMTSLHRQEHPDQVKVKWIPALNAWVPEKRGQNAAQYLTFVNALTLGGDNIDVNLEVEGHELPVLPCSRFLSHMHVHEDQLKALYAQKNATLEAQRIAREKRRAELLAKKPKTQSPRPSPKQVAKVHKTPSPVIKSPSAPPPSSASTKITTSSSKHTSSIPVTEHPDEEEEEEEASEKREDSEDVDEEIANIEKVSVSTQDNLDDEQMNSNPAPSPTPTAKVDASQKAKLKKPPNKASKPAAKQTPKKKPKRSKNKDENLYEKTDVTPETAIEKEEQKEREDLILDIRNTPEPAPESTKPEPPPVSRIPPNPLERRVRWKAQPQRKNTSAPEAREKTSPADTWKGRQSGWLFGDDDYSTALTKETGEQTDQVSDSSGPPPLPEIPSPASTGTSESTGRKPPEKQTVIPDWVKKKYGRKKRDPSWEEEQRRKRLADERREKALEMYERLRRKRYPDEEEIDLSDGPRFEDYGWLAQYCIFQRNNLELFKRTFEAVDDEKKGYLGPVDTILALRAINNKLSLAEEEYLYRIMEIAGYNISAGTDFKLYAVMAALSQRISGLDDWMKHLIGQMDFGTLERKLFMCKTLWECNVDPETNRISIDQLCVELRAGGVSSEHEQEVRDKLGHLGSLDLLDFMSYVPLFIMIHTSVVHNPLDDSRKK